jgi:hypothetical protein
MLAPVVERHELLLRPLRDIVCGPVDGDKANFHNALFARGRNLSLGCLPQHEHLERLLCLDGPGGARLCTATSLVVAEVVLLVPTAARAGRHTGSAVGRGHRRWSG